MSVDRAVKPKTNDVRFGEWTTGLDGWCRRCGECDERAEAVLISCGTWMNLTRHKRCLMSEVTLFDGRAILAHDLWEDCRQAFGSDGVTLRDVSKALARLFPTRRIVEGFAAPRSSTDSVSFNGLSCVRGNALRWCVVCGVDRFGEDCVAVGRHEAGMTAAHLSCLDGHTIRRFWSACRQQQFASGPGGVYPHVYETVDRWLPHLRESLLAACEDASDDLRTSPVAGDR